MALRVAASAMDSIKYKIEVLANNIANSNTVGFKKARVDFTDLFVGYRKKPNGADAPTGKSCGQGTTVTGTTTMFEQGSNKVTNNNMNFAINGAGFFKLLDPINNQPVYTRNGFFKQDEKGTFVNAQGFIMDPPVTISINQKFSHISDDGRVWVSEAGSGTLAPIGQLTLANFPNPAGLQAVGHSNYIPTAASGAETLGPPKLQGIGSISSGVLESSNVHLVKEMIDLLTSSKAFETNQKVIQAEDKLASLGDILK
jgi:flagellar basal-body rod protein FlgG